MKRTNFLKSSFKKTFDEQFNQSIDHSLDQSDLNLYSDVVRNLTPQTKFRSRNSQRNKNFNEYLTKKQGQSKVSLVNSSKYKKQQSLRNISKRNKTSLNNTCSAKNIQKGNQKFANFKQFEKFPKNSLQFNKRKESQRKKFSFKNNSKDFQQKILWDQIKKMSQNELQKFMQEINQFYQQKFPCKNSAEIDTNDSYFTQFQSSKFQEKKFQTQQENEIEQIKKELKEVQGLIKKMKCK